MAKVKPVEPRVVGLQKMVSYSCGCCCEYSIVGTFTGLGWHVFPCYRHAGDGRMEMEQRAEADWKKYLREIRAAGSAGCGEQSGGIGNRKEQGK